MQKHCLKPYEVPVVEIFEVEVEQGFAGTTGSTEDLGDILPDQGWGPSF